MKRLNKLYLKTVISTTLFVNVALANEINTNAARMQAMDKITGRVKEIIIPVKSAINYGNFSMVLRACKKRSAEETPENFAFIDVTDKSFDDEEYNIFRGWVVSSTPGISAIEHPIYDIWLLECTDTDNTNIALLSEEELNARDNIPAKKEISNTQDNEKISEDNNDSEKESKVIRIRDFILEDKDIERNIQESPSYISESNNNYVSDTPEGEEPENLLLFTKIQEKNISDEVNAEETQDISDDDYKLNSEIDAEINKLKNN